MKVVIAPQTFKGSLSALGVAKAMRQGVRRVVPDAETVLVPVADGGDGTLETLVEATGGEIRETEVAGPLGGRVAAAWGATTNPGTWIGERQGQAVPPGIPGAGRRISCSSRATP